MSNDDRTPIDDEQLLRSTALRSASAILAARQRAESELLAAHDALQRKTEQLDQTLATVRATLQATSDAILVTDTEGLISDYNDNFVQMWAVPPALLQPAQPPATLEQFLASKLARPQPWTLRPDAAGLAAMGATPIELHDGRIIEQQARAQYVNGRIVGCVWSFRDVTDQRRSEQALRDETRSLEILYRTGSAIGSTLDLDALLQAVTDAATEVSNAAFGAFFHNNTSPEGHSYLLYTLSGAPREAFEGFGLPRATAMFGPTFRGESPVRCDDVHKDPRYGLSAPHHGMPPGHLPVRSYLAVPVVSRSGEVIGGLFFGHPEPAVFTERSERLVTSIAAQAAVAIDNARMYDAAVKLASDREQLTSAERAARAESDRLGRLKDEFLATLSHELRTPLSAILGWARVLQAKPDDLASVKRGVDAIARNALAQSQLIDELLDVNRIISGKVRLDVQPTDLASVVDAAIESVRPSLETKQLKLRKILDPLAGAVFGDPYRLQQVIWNLLTNAIKFTPRGGRVDVLLSRVASQLELQVSDTGSGIAAEFLPYVFDRFRQADSSTTREHGGLGLGLSIVKNLVELHGGSVRADSAGSGLGSTFTVSLPVAPVRSIPNRREHPAGVSAEAAAAVGTLTLQGVKVVLVDDEPDVCELLSQVLGDAGASVSTASSAAEGLSLLARLRPDVLISDIGMPQVDGYEFIARVRQLPAVEGGSIPAVALTAFARSEDRTRAMVAGYQIHISKPVEPLELIATVSSLVKRAARSAAGAD